MTNGVAQAGFAIGSYRAGAATRTALVLSDRLFDMRDAWSACGSGPTPDWVGFGVAQILGAWPHVASRLAGFAQVAAAAHAGGGLVAAARDLAAVAAPFIPARIFCAASNYVDHAEEMGTALAAKSVSRPYMFLKTASSVIGPNDTVRLPPETAKADWEVELAAVIGCRARRIPVERALDCVAAYTVVNDVSARDLTRRSDYPFKHDWFQGKNHDTFCPLGPWLLPAWLVGDPQRLTLGLTVNGIEMQNGTTADMIWTVAEQIAYLSTIVTLMPGDVVATGTPTGVGMGRGIFLKPGDVMEASVGRIGTLRNPVDAEVMP